MHGLRLAAICALLCAASCSRSDQQLVDHSETFQSLSSTATAVVDAWLKGSVSGTYALTALDQTYVMVEQERASLTASASTVIDARGASLADSASELARRIAVMISAVRSADSGVARQQLDDLPFRNES
jgi:hypothetical protein